MMLPYVTYDDAHYDDINFVASRYFISPNVVQFNFALHNNAFIHLSDFVVFLCGIINFVANHDHNIIYY